MNRSLKTIGIVIAGVLVMTFLLAQVRIARRAARQSESASNLAHVQLALAAYWDMKGVTPPLTYRDASGSPTYSWRLATSNCFRSAPPLHLDQNKPWNHPPNLAYADHPHWFYCVHGDRRSTNVFAIEAANSFFGRSNVEEWDFPEDLAVTLSVDIDSNHHWAAPGDARLDGDELVVGTFRIPVTEDFTCFAGFADTHVWEIRGRKSLEMLFEFANLEFASRNSRAKLAELGCKEIWPRKEAD